MATRTAVNQFTKQMPKKDSELAKQAYETRVYELTSEELEMIGGGQVIVNTV